MKRREFLTLLLTAPLVPLAKALPTGPKLYKCSYRYVDCLQVAGLGTFTLKPEGYPIAFDDPIGGPNCRGCK